MVRSKNPFWGIFIPLQNDLLLRTHGPRCLVRSRQSTCSLRQRNPLVA